MTDSPQPRSGQYRATAVNGTVMCSAGPCPAPSSVLTKLTRSHGSASGA